MKENETQMPFVLLDKARPSSETFRVPDGFFNDLPDQIAEEVKEERYHRFMETQQRISAARLQSKIGRTIKVLIDEVDDEGAIGRSFADAPEIDGAVYLNGETSLKPGDLVDVVIEEADEYDLWGSLVE